MSLGKVPMKAVGGAKRNASIEQVSTATQRAATTQDLFPSKVLGRGEGVTRDLRQIPKKKLTKHLPLAPKRPKDNTYANKSKGLRATSTIHPKYSQ